MILLDVGMRLLASFRVREGATGHVGEPGSRFHAGQFLTLLSVILAAGSAQAQLVPMPSAETSAPASTRDRRNPRPFTRPYSGPFAALDIPFLSGGLSFFPGMVRTPSKSPSRDYTGLPLRGWMLYPSLLAGPLYDDNVFQSSRYKKSSFGLRATPSIVADLDTGIHRFTLYAGADGRYYFHEPSASFFNARLGGVYDWEARRDLLFRLAGEYARGLDALNNGTVGAAGNINGIFAPTGNINGVIGPTGNIALSTPRLYNQFLGSASVQKTFDQSFIILGGRATQTLYGRPLIANAFIQQQSQNGATFETNGRLGYHLSPSIYGYTEAVLNFRRLENSLYNSSGYRAVGGLGSDRIGLFRGEIYGGFQEQTFTSAQPSTVASPLFGGNVQYAPTPLLTLAASLDQTIAASNGFTIPNSIGPLPGMNFAAHVTSAAVGMSYLISPALSARVRVGYDWLAYTGGARVDRDLTVSGVLNYNVFRNLDITLDCQAYKFFSRLPQASYERNIFTLGLGYKY